MKAALALILLVGGGFAYFQPMRWLIDSWMVNPYYKHGFIVALASAALAGYKIVNSKPTEDKTRQWIYYLAAGVVVYLIGWAIGLNYLKTVPVFFLLLSVAYLFENRVPAHSLRFPLLFPILAIPIPFLPELTAFLQFAMAGLSTGILQIFGYEIVAEGALIHLPNATFLIAEPSSGIQSLIALLTLMIPVVYFSKTTPRKKIVLYLLIIPVAMLGNLLRIVTLFLVGYYYGEATAADFWHDRGNILFFTSTITFLLLLGYLIIYGFKSPNAKRA
ncbi:MAG: exosortase/archaeosortase family protein [Nitrospina sp.]|nr:MAG: exosortase/archaeosortase family protein [Nitrospina sp.]